MHSDHTSTALLSSLNMSIQPSRRRPESRAYRQRGHSGLRLVAGRVCGSIVLSSLHGPLGRVVTDGMWKESTALA
jgi:hypothetical protein